MSTRPRACRASVARLRARTPLLGERGRRHPGAGADRARASSSAFVDLRRLGRRRAGNGSRSALCWIARARRACSPRWRSRWRAASCCWDPPLAPSGRCAPARSACRGAHAGAGRRHARDRPGPGRLGRLDARRSSGPRRHRRPGRSVRLASLLVRAWAPASSRSSWPLAGHDPARRGGSLGIVSRDRRRRAAAPAVRFRRAAADPAPRSPAPATATIRTSLPDPTTSSTRSVRVDPRRRRRRRRRRHCGRASRSTTSRDAPPREDPPRTRGSQPALGTPTPEEAEDGEEDEADRRRRPSRRPLGRWTAELTPQGRYRGSVTDDPDFVWRGARRRAADALERRSSRSPTPPARSRPRARWSRRSGTSASRPR